MFGERRRRRRKKDSVLSDAGVSAPDVGDLADGCGCDLPLIALTVMAGASLLYLVR